MPPVCPPPTFFPVLLTSYPPHRELLRAKRAASSPNPNWLANREPPLNSWGANVEWDFPAGQEWPSLQSGGLQGRGTAGASDLLPPRFGQPCMEGHSVVSTSSEFSGDQLSALCSTRRVCPGLECRAQQRGLYFRKGKVCRFVF